MNQGGALCHQETTMLAGSARAHVPQQPTSSSLLAETHPASTPRTATPACPGPARLPVSLSPSSVPRATTHSLCSSFSVCCHWDLSSKTAGICLSCSMLFAHLRWPGSEAALNQPRVSG